MRVIFCVTLLGIQNMLPLSAADKTFQQKYQEFVANLPPGIGIQKKIKEGRTCYCKYMTSNMSAIPTINIPEMMSPLTTIPWTTLPPSSIPETTTPEITIPETTIPETTIPWTSLPPTTISETTIPWTTLPPTTIPETTTPETTTLPPTTIPETTIPLTTKPPTTTPKTTIPLTTKPPTTTPKTTIPLTTKPPTTTLKTTIPLTTKPPTTTHKTTIPLTTMPRTTMPPRTTVQVTVGPVSMGDFICNTTVTLKSGTPYKIISPSFGKDYPRPMHCEITYELPSGSNLIYLSITGGIIGDPNISRCTGIKQDYVRLSVVNNQNQPIGPSKTMCGRVGAMSYMTFMGQKLKFLFHSEAKAKTTGMTGLKGNIQVY